MADSMKELVLRECIVDFGADRSNWPFNDFTSHVLVEAVDMPMVKMRNMFGGKSVWVNTSIIKKILINEGIYG